MAASDVARRTVAFFLLTSVANVVALALVGLGLAARLLPVETRAVLTIVPATVALLAVVGALLVGRLAGHLRRRLERGNGRPAGRESLALKFGELGGLIPVPGGIGGVDAGLIGTLVLYRVPITHATSAVLAYRAIALWVPALLAAPALVGLRRALREDPGVDPGLHSQEPALRSG
jgi:hypothetical protein